jgi:hypothetical protein
MARSYIAVATALSTWLGVTLAPNTASADTIIRDPNPPRYSVELEPKLNLNYFLFEYYGGSAWGPGVRASIPIMSPGFIKTLNNSVGITFGLDLMRYSGDGYYGWYRYCTGNPRNCPGWYVGYDTAFWALLFPVAMQWNFFITDRWSVFGEPGLTIRHAFFDDVAWCQPGVYDPRFGPCNREATSLYFTFYAGGRFHFNEKLALTMRIGHPTTFSIGLSIFL